MVNLDSGPAGNWTRAMQIAREYKQGEIDDEEFKERCEMADLDPAEVQEILEVI